MKFSLNFSLNWEYSTMKLAALIKWYIFMIKAPSELPYPPSRNMDVLTYGSFLTMGMSLLVSLFIIFPIVERTSGAKHLQMMTGLHPVTYWISNLAWDYLIYLFSSVMMLILLMAMDHEKTFTSFQAPGKFRVQHELWIMLLNI